MTRWWRAYGRARHDPKLLKLSDKQFRWWFNLICVASDNGGGLPSHADIAVEFRASGKAITDVLDELIAAGLFDHDETGIRPHNWNALQYVSDSSSNRVKQFRERQRNVSETPSETESDTEQSRTESRRSRAQRIPADWKPSEALEAFAKQINLDCKTVAENFVDYWQAASGSNARKLDWDAAFRVWCRRQDGQGPNRPQAKSFAQQARESANSVTPSDDLSQWRARLSGKGRWMDELWGPAPGQPGCRVPSALLSEAQP